MTDPNPEVPDISSLRPVESIEPPLSAEDQADLDSLTDDPPTYHSLLQVWQTILAPAEEEQTERVGPNWGSRITQMYPQIKMQQMTEFRDRYFSKILELKHILDGIVEEFPEALQHLDMEADATENAVHYKNILFLWQAQIVQWEKEWDCEDEFAAVELGAISEVHKMFFGAEGVTAFLDNIGFEFTEDDQVELRDLLDEIKAG